MEFKEQMRKYAKNQYHTNQDYKNYMKMKSMIYRKAQSILVKKYRREFDLILKRLRGKVED